MACKYTYKGITYNSKEEFINQVINPQILGKPDVILPIGTSGSGKSTFIKSLPQKNLVVIEPDAMRVEFTGNINDKSKDKEIYIEAANRAVAVLKANNPIDVENLSPEERLRYYKILDMKKSDGGEITLKDINENPTLYQITQNREQEAFVASEKTIRDLAARIADRIGMKVVFESDRSKDYKGKIENNIAYINLAYATLDTPIHEILGHPIIRAIKNKDFTIPSYVYVENSKNTLIKDSKDVFTVRGAKNSEEFGTKSFNTKEEAQKYADKLNQARKTTTTLYQNLLKELETGRGKEVLDRIKRDYVNKEKSKSKNYNLIDKNNNSEIEIIQNFGNYWFKEYNETLTRGKQFNSNEELESLINKEQNKHLLGKYTLEEQQEEAIVELMSLMVADKLNTITDKNLISLLKQLLKQINDFIKSLLNTKELNIDDIEADNTKFLIENKLKELIKNGTIKKEC